MKRQQLGMSLMEVLAAIGILATLIFATVTVTSSALTSSRNNMDKQFATQKAISMLEELKSLVQVSGGAQVTILDNYNDGSAFRDRLTTVGLLTADPAEPVSGNTASGSGWLYSRQISVLPLADPSDATLIVSSTDVRLVRVRVYKNSPNGSRRLLAEVASVVQTLAVSFPPSQVYDVYCIAIENVPGWWVNMSSLIPFVQAAINDLQSRHPGLVFRQNWITKMSYGRDSQYKPYINTVNDSLSAVPWVYYYPGVMPATYVPEGGGAAVVPPAIAYYQPGNFQATMRDDTGGGSIVRPLDATTNPAPYTLADQYNNAMRLPDERALYDRRRTAVNGSGNLIYPGEQPTLRLLLEDMCTNPTKYKNALIVNLHGELLPFPPIRNYSDAAKKPDQYTPNGVRVVTHPEQLAYANTDPVKLRVYSYVMDPNSAVTKSGTALTANKEWLPEPITVVVRGVNWTPAAGEVVALSGGVDFDNSGARDAYTTVNAPTTDTGVAGTARMYYTRTLVGTDTVIKLYNTPVRQPCAPSANCAGSGGIFHSSSTNTRRLYGLEYVPSPLEDFAQATAQTPFSYNLTTQGQMHKNTARWVLTIPTASLTNDRMIQVDTRIGDYSPSTGAFTPAYTQPTNLSSTYVWRGTTNWLYGAAGSIPNLPMTERFQVLGDPRHCPYADLKKPHADNGGLWSANNVSTKLGMGYNRYFDDFENAGEGQQTALEASETSTVAGPYLILATNQVFACVVNGNPITFNLTTGLARTAAQVVSDLNGNSGFSAVAIADVVSNKVRVKTLRKGPTASFQFNTGASNDAGAVLGFTNETFTGYGWQGWSYTIGGVQYGVKTNGVNDDDGWTTTNGQVEVDVPRIFQIFRGALLKTNSVYTTMTGFPYYYLGIGNEIGYDSDQGWPDNLPVNARPWDATTTRYFEQAITPGKNWGDADTPRCGVKYIQSGDKAWWGMHWLGELYPDDRYSIAGANNDWSENGNLPSPAMAAPNAANVFRRIRRDSNPGDADANRHLAQNDPGDRTHTPGTTFVQGARRLHEQGVGYFFWAGTASTVAVGGGATGNLAGGGNTPVTGGAEVNKNYNFPLDDPIASNRAFVTNGGAIRPAPGGTTPFDGLGLSNYGGNLTLTTAPWDMFYNSDDSPKISSGLIAARDAATTDAMFVLQNGLSPSGVAGTDFVARWAFLGVIQSFLEAGRFNSGNDPAITELPRIRIDNPNPNTDLTSPSSINVSWVTTWNRWDGKKYTNSYASTFTESSALSYFVMYSADNGQSWKYIQDRSAAIPGTPLPSTDSRYSTVHLTANSATWPTAAANFPEGTYIVRVEAYRDSFPLHYSFHQYQVSINR